MIKALQRSLYSPMEGLLDELLQEMSQHSFVGCGLSWMSCMSSWVWDRILDEVNLWPEPEKQFLPIFFCWKSISELCHIGSNWSVQEGGRVRVLFYTCWKRNGETAGLERLAWNVSYFSDHWISQDSLASLLLLLNYMLWWQIILVLVLLSL